MSFNTKTKSSSSRRGKRQKVPVTNGSETEETYEVERVLNKKTYKGKVYYQLKWVGCNDPSWETASSCKCDNLILEYEERMKRQSADEDENEWEVEKILDKRIVDGNKVEYLVKWKNWKGDHEWIREEDCLCVNLIGAYENPKLKKMWNFQGSNPNLWIDRETILAYMKSFSLKKKYRVNFLEFEPDFPDNEQPLKLLDGLNIGPLSYKDHWYLVVIFVNHIIFSKRLLVGDPLNTLFGSRETRAHPVFKRLTGVYPQIPVKPLTMTQMDRSDVCGYYLLAAFERALFVYDKKAAFVPEKLFFDYARPELIRSELRPDTNNEFSVSLPVTTSYLVGPRCEFCEKFFEHDKLVDKHIKKEHFG